MSDQAHASRVEAEGRPRLFAEAPGPRAHPSAVANYLDPESAHALAREIPAFHRIEISLAAWESPATSPTRSEAICHSPRPSSHRVQIVPPEFQFGCGPRRKYRRHFDAFERYQLLCATKRRKRAGWTHWNLRGAPART